ncbi:MAG: hypothetical protein KatS3mg111_2137 [Pirellulaceae bacterium]|nr:MAG: hypothetical protein KatS3mg111_2137 [Pirellulaceae bacterium]
MGAPLVLPWSRPCAGAPVESPEPRSWCTLGFSTYGMPSLTTEAAIDHISKVGFDAVELAIRAGADADAAHLPSARRRAIAQLLRDRRLRLSSLMEHVFPARQQQGVLERLRLAAQLAHDLSPDSPPIIQTVLGSGAFSANKGMLRDALGQWVALADANAITLAIKPHRGGVVSRPSEAIWLLEQLGSPARLKMVYDYSHFAYRGMDLAATIQQSLPHTVHVAVKDVVRESHRVRFALPGSTGTIDYRQLLSQFFAGGYRGDFNCEVSSMLWSAPDYDPLAACRSCYAAMSRLFQQADVPRPSSSAAAQAN